MNFFKNLKKKLKKILCCFDAETYSVAVDKINPVIIDETYPIIKHYPIFTIGHDDSDNSDSDFNY